MVIVWNGWWAGGSELGFAKRNGGLCGELRSTMLLTMLLEGRRCFGRRGAKYRTGMVTGEMRGLGGQARVDGEAHYLGLDAVMGAVTC